MAVIRIWLSDQIAKEVLEVATILGGAEAGEADGVAKHVTR